MEVGHVVDRVALEAGESDERAGDREPGDGQHRADRPMCEVADDHALGQPEPSPDSRRQGQAAAIQRWCRRPHRFGGRQPNGFGESGQGAGRHRCPGHQQAERRSAGIDGEVKGGEAEEVDVQARQQVAQPDAENDARGGTDHVDRQSQQEVMDADRRIAVAEGLQHADDLALASHAASQHQVQQEGRGTEENERHDGRVHLQLVELVLDEPVRQLLVAPVRADAPEVGQPAVQRGDDIAGRCVRLQRHGQVIERALQSGQRRQLAVVHPRDRVPSVVRQEAARRDGVDELRRVAGPDDDRIDHASVDDHPQPVAGVQPPCHGEGRADDQFLATRCRWPSFLQRDRVESVARP